VLCFGVHYSRHHRVNETEAGSGPTHRRCCLSKVGKHRNPHLKPNSYRETCILVHFLYPLHPEDDGCNAHQNSGTFSTSDAARRRKLKLHIAHSTGNLRHKTTMLEKNVRSRICNPEKRKAVIVIMERCARLWLPFL
jgi:hypothetical protein